MTALCRLKMVQNKKAQALEEAEKKLAAVRVVEHLALFDIV